MGKAKLSAVELQQRIGRVVETLAASDPDALERWIKQAERLADRRDRSRTS